MSKHKKHNFHCQRCASECTIYKKGKGHRVLVCPNCGVLATNPTLAGRILRGASSGIPVIGGAVSGIIGGIQDNKDAKMQKPEVSMGKGRLTSFEKALMLEALEN